MLRNVFNGFEQLKLAQSFKLQDMHIGTYLKHRLHIFHTKGPTGLEWVISSLEYFSEYFGDNSGGATNLMPR
jgi:hypothetical protein